MPKKQRKVSPIRTGGSETGRIAQRSQMAAATAEDSIAEKNGRYRRDFKAALGKALANETTARRLKNLSGFSGVQRLRQIFNDENNLVRLRPNEDPIRLKKALETLGCYDLN